MVNDTSLTLNLYKTRNLSQIYLNNYVNFPMFSCFSKEQIFFRKTIEITFKFFSNQRLFSLLTHHR